MMKILRKRRKGGFTLIELIVVIAILGILAALAIPRLTGLQDNANKKAILGNLKMLENAAETYAADNNVDIATVTQAMLVVELVPNWPVGPKATTTYTLVAGAAPTAVLTAAIPGVPIGSYTSASAGLQ